MSGTTLCPNCDTRFRVTEAQLEAHHGMVRCGHCMQAFNALPGFIPDKPDPQLELPIPDAAVEPAVDPPADEPHPAVHAEAGEEAAIAEESGPVEEHGPVEENEPVALAGPGEEAAPAAEPAAGGEPGLLQEAEPLQETGPLAAHPPTDEAVAAAAAIPHGDLLDFSQPAFVTPEDKPSLAATHSDIKHVAPSPALAEQVAIVQDEDDSESQPAPRNWPWAVAAFLLLLMALLQAAYFFRIELAARLPGLKPALIAYCQLLGCSVPLPQKTDLMSIESSDLEADPAHENQITLNALLRNRAPYAQAFPNLELTLNDTLDKPLARRTFKPKDYLPPMENEKTGLLPNHELSIKLYLGTAELRPTGYRLALHYPKQ